jgi:uncharacterized membrane protein
VNPDFYERLDLRMRRLETELSGLRAEIDTQRGSAAVAPVPVPAQPVAAQVFAPPPVAPPPVAPPDDGDRYRQMFGAPPPANVVAKPAKPKGSLEAALAGRGMQLVGLLLVLLATGYFLDVAFTHGWVPPAARIGLGLVVGSVLMLFAARRIGSDLTFLAEGLIGLGAGIDYLSLWASIAVFPELHVPRAAAFGAMVIVTAVLALLATRRRSERLALMGLAGGLLTPLLLNSDHADHALLAGYLLILTATMLAIGIRSSFRFVEWLTFVGVLCYGPAFAIDRPHHWNDVACTVVAALFFAAFALAATLGAVYDKKASAARLTLLALDTAGFALVLFLIYSERQSVLGLSLLGLAAVLVATARFVRLPYPLGFAYFYLGLAAASLALPALFHAVSLLDVFTVEAGLLVLIATRTGHRLVALAGALIFAWNGFALLALAATNPPQHQIVNELAVGVALYVAALSFALSRLSATVPGDRALRPWRAIAIVALNVVALAGLSRESVDLFGGPKGLDDLTSQAQFGLSAVWTLYATGLFAAGMARHDGLLRWLGIILFACVIVKVLAVDLASLDVTFRILSSLGLGIVLIGVSAWYQRAMVRQKAAGTET